MLTPIKMLKIDLYIKTIKFITTFLKTISLHFISRKHYKTTYQ